MKNEQPIVPVIPVEKPHSDSVHSEMVKKTSSGSNYVPRHPDGKWKK